MKSPKSSDLSISQLIPELPFKRMKFPVRMQDQHIDELLKDLNHLEGLNKVSIVPEPIRDVIRTLLQTLTRLGFGTDRVRFCAEGYSVEFFQHDHVMLSAIANHEEALDQITTMKIQHAAKEIAARINAGCKPPMKESLDYEIPIGLL